MTDEVFALAGALEFPCNTPKFVIEGGGYLEIPEPPGGFNAGSYV